MSNGNWHRVWQAKGASRPVAGPSRGLLGTLMELDGYHSPTSSPALEDHEVQFRYIVDTLRIGPGDSVYEVGCGAGALLYWLRSRCAAVGGSDFAASQVAHARVALPDSTDLWHCEASDIEPEPRYDVVVSNGVFIYFDSEAYAYEVLLRMIAKARRAIGVLDVNDAARRAEFEAERRARQRGRSTDYTGLTQLYLRREFFEEVAAARGLRCVIEDSATPNSVNARYRYHVAMFSD
jgi:cyclopropane fatty-acyl-phospholipid synthase-like methyltransferase